MVRHRLEDLGRILELTAALLEEDIFETTRWGRAKDADEWFAALSKKQKEEQVVELAYGLRNIRSKLFDILAIANGTDIHCHPDGLEH